MNINHFLELSENQSSGTCSNLDNNESSAMEVECGNSNVGENETLTNIDNDRADDTSTILDKHESFKPVSKGLHSIKSLLILVFLMVQ